MMKMYVYKKMGQEEGFNEPQVGGGGGGGEGLGRRETRWHALNPQGSKNHEKEEMCSKDSCTTLTRCAAVVC